MGSHGNALCPERCTNWLGLQRPSCKACLCYGALSMAWLAQDTPDTPAGPVKKKAEPGCFRPLKHRLFSCLAADAFFKAAISLIPEVPKMINIDGKMRLSESFLLEFLCNFFSTLLIVPVRFTRRAKRRWCPSLICFIFILSPKSAGMFYLYLHVGFLVRCLNYSMYFFLTFIY